MQTDKLKKIANKIRQLIIISLLRAESGHPGGALGMTDIFTYLYFNYLNLDPENPWKEERDRLYLSNGHICPVLYSSLALKGFFPIKKLSKLRDISEELDGHPIYRSLPGIENTSGPLGQGISQAVGCAVSLKKEKNKIICIISDGELQEGQTWEALMFIGNSKLKNLTVILDRNNIQISENTERVMPLEPLKEKVEAFNLIPQEINAHNFTEIEEALKRSEMLDKPSFIIANTTGGKGVSFMEGDYSWHGKAPSKEEAKQAIKELKGG